MHHIAIPISLAAIELFQRRHFRYLTMTHKAATNKTLPIYCRLTPTRHSVYSIYEHVPNTHSWLAGGTVPMIRSHANV